MIRVLSPGLLTTVQDLGRFGYGHLGVSPAGAADPVALRVGNLLVGNEEGAPALEMTLAGGAFLFEVDTFVAVAGSIFEADVPWWCALPVRAGATLRIGPTRSGARCYLCVAGGIASEPFLGSASTHVLTSVGGRALKKGDLLRLGAASGPSRRLKTGALTLLPYRRILRVTRGPQADWFDFAAFLTPAYTVTEQADRMGLRIRGPAPVEMRNAREMVTEGTPLGAVQVPAGGDPIVLFVDQQTTGGYPKIANVISADFASLGQLRPRDEIRFEEVSPETARSLIVEQERLIASGDLFE
jgi:antagonist of KipI